jgi:rsbT antagonist protein RsbS
VIIDVSSVDLLDSFATRMLRSIAQITRLRGAETVIVGIAPDVAFAMVQLGLTLEGISTVLDLDEAMEMLQARLSLPGNAR